MAIAESHEWNVNEHPSSLVTDIDDAVGLGGNLLSASGGPPTVTSVAASSDGFWISTSDARLQFWVVDVQASLAAVTCRNDMRPGASFVHMAYSGNTLWTVTSDLELATCDVRLGAPANATALPSAAISKVGAVHVGRGTALLIMTRAGERDAGGGGTGLAGRPARRHPRLRRGEPPGGQPRHERQRSGRRRARRGDRDGLVRVPLWQYRHLGRRRPRLHDNDHGIGSDRGHPLGRCRCRYCIGHRQRGRLGHEELRRQADAAERHGHDQRCNAPGPVCLALWTLIRSMHRRLCGDGCDLGPVRRPAWPAGIPLPVLARLATGVHRWR